MILKQVSTIWDVVKEGLCVSCGACVVASDLEKINWGYDKRRGMGVPQVARQRDGADLQNAFAICPGKGVEIMRLSKEVCSSNATYDIQTGYMVESFAAKTTDKRLLTNASSGGVMTGIAKYLLSAKKVDGVIATRFTYGPQGPVPQAIIVHDSEELIQCQGSKYCPVSIHEPLIRLKNTKEKVALIGTPCQIAAVRMLMERFEWLRENVLYMIGSFCGGMKDFRNMNTIIQRQDIKPAEVTNFSFRGGGQPGRMLIQDSSGNIKTRPYPDYGTDAGFKKLERCRLCVDGTAELADIACGDAWVPRFLESGNPWSIVLARNEQGAGILREMLEKGLIEKKDITLDEIKYSQQSNLSSKKKRQAARRRLYQLIGSKLPIYDGGFPLATTSIWLEGKVLASHFVLRSLETLRLYVPFIKCARWIRRTNEFKQSTGAKT